MSVKNLNLNYKLNNLVDDNSKLTPNSLIAISNEVSNLVALCRDCHGKKTAMDRLDKL